MSLHSRIASLALAAALALLGGSASAVDLTGSYTGKLKCKGLDAGGVAGKLKNKSSTMSILQDGSDVRVSVDGLPFEGAVLDQSGKEEQKGRATVSACDNDGDPDARLEAMQLDAKVSPKSGKATLKLTSVRGTSGGYVCTGTYKRASQDPPALAACPVFYTCVCSGTGGGTGACGNGGIGGDPGSVHVNVTQALHDSSYVNGNDTGWVCVQQ